MSQEYCRDAGYLILHPGDLVTRTGDDVHEILSINEGRDLITVRCISDISGIYAEGEIESNLPRRYSFVSRGPSSSEFPVS